MGVVAVLKVACAIPFSGTIHALCGIDDQTDNEWYCACSPSIVQIFYRTSRLQTVLWELNSGIITICVYGKQ